MLHDYPIHSSFVFFWHEPPVTHPSSIRSAENSINVTFILSPLGFLFVESLLCIMLCIMLRIDSDSNWYDHPLFANACLIPLVT
jgi:hypothetical protein